MTGLHLTIPAAFEVRVATITEDRRGRQIVTLEARLMVNDPPSEWQQSEPLLVERGDRLSLALDHTSSGQRP